MQTVDGRRLSVDDKKRKELGEFKAHKKTPPQFADANEEGVYRSATQKSSIICVF